MNLVLELLTAVVLWVVALPPILILSTPFILISAAYDPAPFGYAVGSRYGAVIRFWEDFGPIFF